MPFLDPEAADLVREMRTARGLSPEAMSREICNAAFEKGWKRGTVDAFTIRRIERGFVPGVRVAFVVAQFFGVMPHDLWKPSRRVKVSA